MKFLLLRSPGICPSWLRLGLVALLVLPTGLAAAEPIVVENPKNLGQRPRSVDLEKLWEAGHDGGELLLGVVGEILVGDDDRVYILDRQLAEVQVLSAEGEPLAVLGREGEGPGEFRNPSDMALLPDGRLAVLQTMPAKIALLSTDGVALDDHPLPPHDGMRAVIRASSQKDRLVVAFSLIQFAQAKAERVGSLVALEADGSIAATYFEERSEQDFAAMEMQEQSMDGFAGYWILLADGRVLVAPSFEEYRLHAYRADGSLERIVERAYAPVIRSDEERELAEASYQIVINGREAKILTSEIDRAIHGLFARSDGGFWILSGRGIRERPEGTLARLDAYDVQGTLVEELVLPLEGDPRRDRLFIADDLLFVARGMLDGARSLVKEQDEDDDRPTELIVEAYRILD